MAQVDLTIDQLSPDSANPRIDSAASEREALEKIINHEPEKFIRLARSIAKQGLNPMDRLLVFRPKKKRTYTVLEGNRRAAALRVLVNPVSLKDMSIERSVRKRLEDVAKTFDADKVEPIACFDVGSPDAANPWLTLRHTGENEGVGVVPWNPTSRSRFLGGEPTLEVLDFVKANGQLSESQLDKIDGGSFKLTTLRRLIDSPAVREKIGIEVVDGQVSSGLPAEELVKPLRHFVIDVLEGKVTSRKLGNVRSQMEYVASLPRRSKPKLSTVGSLRKITGIGAGAGRKEPKARKKAGKDPSSRATLIASGTSLNIADPKIGAIAAELRKLRVETYPHAASVLLRVFLELSTDHYMEQYGLPTTVKLPNGRSVDKSLDKKVRAAIAHLIKSGARKKDFDGLDRALNDKQSPLYIRLLHSYVHNQFVIPKTRDLLASWDEARPYLERIWA